MLLFKVLILQSLYNLSDEGMEYQILDRYSFSRFLGAHASNQIPDAVKESESGGACLWGTGEAGGDDDLTGGRDWSGESEDRVTQLGVQPGSI